MNEVKGYVSANTITAKDTFEILEARRRYLRWTEGERVLDIGCGPGDVTNDVLLPFLPRDSTLVGCDVSEAMLKNCNRYKINGRLMFKKLDIQQKWLNNGWENEAFNKIFSFYCLHWITDHRQAMRNIYSLLKPGGEILLMFMTPDNAVYIAFETLKQSPKWNRFVKDIRWFFESSDSISFCEDLLESAGFQEVDCYLKTSDHNIASWNTYLELMKSVNPFLRHIPDEMKSEYFGEFEELLKKQRHIRFDGPDGGITVEYNMVVAAAKKFPRKKSIA
ncbi:juvenile hormone acid O-methyltransferase isoform X2 [Halyomorpha halys]|nr:juvenile hormone acid O-methyltransferase-like [Halyomorpha halys]